MSGAGNLKSLLTLKNKSRTDDDFWTDDDDEDCALFLAAWVSKKIISTKDFNPGLMGDEPVPYASSAVVAQYTA